MLNRKLSQTVKYLVSNHRVVQCCVVRKCSVCDHHTLAVFSLIQTVTVFRLYREREREVCLSVVWVSPLSSHLSAAKVLQHALPWLSLSQAESSRLSKVTAIAEISGVSGQLQDQHGVQVQGSDLHQWDHHLTGTLWQEIYRLLHLSVWKVGCLSSFSTVVLASS